jgi:hypothetical protein
VLVRGESLATGMSDYRVTQIERITSRLLPPLPFETGMHCMLAAGDVWFGNRQKGGRGHGRRLGHSPLRPTLLGRNDQSIRPIGAGDTGLPAGDASVSVVGLTSPTFG